MRKPDAIETFIRWVMQTSSQNANESSSPGAIATTPKYCDVTISIVPPGAVEADLRDQKYNYADDLDALLTSLAERIGLFSLTFKDDVGGWMTLRLDQTQCKAAQEWSHKHTEITGFDVKDVM